MVKRTLFCLNIARGTGLSAALFLMGCLAWAEAADIAADDLTSTGSLEHGAHWEERI